MGVTGPLSVGVGDGAADIVLKNAAAIVTAEKMEKPSEDEDRRMIAESWRKRWKGCFRDGGTLR